MKKFSKFRNKLTAKQASNYSFIFSSVFTAIICIMITIAIWPKIGAFSIIVGIGLFIPYWALSTQLFRCLFDVNSKIWIEEEKNAKQRVIANLNLNTEKRIKVKCNFEKMIEESPNKKMLVKLLQISEYNFYLKLVGSNSVSFIITNKQDYIIHVDTIQNFIYVETYFEKIDV